MVEQIKYKVLLIGSGLMTPPLVDYLVSFNDTRITVASNIIKDAEKIAKRHPTCMSAMFLDVMDVSKVNSNLITGSGSGAPSKAALACDFLHSSMDAYESIKCVHQTRSEYDHFKLHLTRHGETT
jgi:hypothetical protein